MLAHCQVMADVLLCSVRPEGTEKTTPNMYKFLTLNVNKYLQGQMLEKISGKGCEKV